MDTIHNISSILWIGVDIITPSNGSILSEQEIKMIYVDNKMAFYFKIIVYISMSGLVSLVGMVANLFNMIVFLKQGIFTESSIVSLFCLAVSDFCWVTTMLWLSTSFAIALANPSGLNWNPYDVMYLTGAWPHLMLAQFTRMVTAFIAFERCVCVVFPFKVKAWFVPKRSLTITQQFRFRSDPTTNETKLGLVFLPQREITMSVLFYINSVINTGCVGIVLLCTTITVSRVNLSKAWRETFTKTKNLSPKDPEVQDSSEKSSTVQTSTKTQQISNMETSDNASSGQKSSSKKQPMSNVWRERRMIKMVTTISLIFLACYFPDFVFFIIYLINPDIRILGPYDNLAHVIYSFTFLSETLNSSSNILVYYHMSSKFKQVMKQMLHRTKESVNIKS